MNSNEPPTQTDETEARPAANGEPCAADAPQPVLRPCPYCGHLGENDGVQEQCSKCKGWFEPLSRQASQNSMGPWFFHDDAVPFRPGCSYETLRKLINKGRVTGETIIRGPGTNQFWVYARNAPGVAHLMGLCHNCGSEATENAFLCEHCGAAFPGFKDRQQLGLAPVRLLPGQADASNVAASALHSDPGESDYGPVAPTFATASVEAATAHAERVTSDRQARNHETIDESPELTQAQATRRERQHGRMKMTIGLLVFVIVALVIAVVALVLQQGIPSASVGDRPASNTVAPTPEPIEEAIVPIVDGSWSQRLAEANRLIESDDPAQVESGLATLIDARANAPLASLPTDLDATISRVSERVDEARLRKFLDKND